jgi:hypothetical protein
MNKLLAAVTAAAIGYVLFKPPSTTKLINAMNTETAAIIRVAQGGCAHRRTVPVNLVNGERVGDLCTDCDKLINRMI